MKKEKIKQWLLVISAIFLIGIGFLNYEGTSKNDFVEVASRGNGNDITLGDVEFVSTNAVIVPNNEILENDNSVSSSITSNESNEIESNITTDEKDEYFEKTRIERENMYSQMIETYEKMLSNEDITAEQKSIASQEISNITKTKNGIMIAENLIKTKGFDDVIILINNNSASVVVKTKKLENEEIAKIQNIISRELEIDVGNINISSK